MRLQDAFDEIDRPDVKRAVTEALKICYPAGKCGMFTQALMELGALVCVPNGAPHCQECPVAALCRSRKQETQALLPVRKKKLPDAKNSGWSGFCSVGNGMQSVSDRKADCWQGCGSSQTSWEQ